MIKAGHVHTNLGEAGRECRALRSPAAYWFCRDRIKKHSAHKHKTWGRAAHNLDEGLSSLHQLCSEENKVSFNLP